MNTEEVSSLSEIAAVDFGKRISDNFLADILVEGKNVCEYKIYKYNLRYVLVFDGFGEFLVTAESLDDILKNVVN